MRAQVPSSVMRQRHDRNGEETVLGRLEGMLTSLGGWLHLKGWMKEPTDVDSKALSLGA